MKTAVVCLMLFVSSVACSFAEDGWKPYLTLETGYSWMNMDSGGFNTAGPHNNTGDDSDSSILLGAKAGLARNGFRGDLSFTYRDTVFFETGSYAPPVPIYFYDSKISIYNLMLSAYYDLLSFNHFTMYGGIGLGASFIDMKTDDTVVSGHGNDTTFAWQAELGVEYPITRNLLVYGGYRYVDLGSSKIDLSVSTDIPAGNFKADLAANELIIGVRYPF